jgi:hypothetical protein
VERWRGGEETTSLKLSLFLCFFLCVSASQRLCVSIVTLVLNPVIKPKILDLQVKKFSTLSRGGGEVERRPHP